METFSSITPYKIVSYISGGGVFRKNINEKDVFCLRFAEIISIIHGMNKPLFKE